MLRWRGNIHPQRTEYLSVFSRNKRLVKPEVCDRCSPVEKMLQIRDVTFGCGIGRSEGVFCG